MAKTFDQVHCLQLSRHTQLASLDCLCFHSPDAPQTWPSCICHGLISFLGILLLLVTFPISGWFALKVRLIGLAPLKALALMDDGRFPCSLPLPLNIVLSHFCKVDWARIFYSHLSDKETEAQICPTSSWEPNSQVLVSGPWPEGAHKCLCPIFLPLGYAKLEMKNTQVGPAGNER